MADLPAIGTAITANGSYNVPAAYKGKLTHFLFQGTFDGATVKVDESADNSVWTPVQTAPGTYASLTSAGNFNVLCPFNMRVTVSGGGGSLSLKAFITNAQ